MARQLLASCPADLNRDGMVGLQDPGENPANPAHWDKDNVGVVGPNHTTFTDTSVCPNGAYQYKVRASGDCGYSDYSYVASVTPPLPNAPTNCQAERQGGSPNPDPIEVTWAYSGPAVSGFRIARLDPGEDINNPAHWDNVGEVGHGQRSWTDNSPGRQNNAIYYYKVRAFVDTPCGRFFGPYSNHEAGKP